MRTPCPHMHHSALCTHASPENPNPISTLPDASWWFGLGPICSHRHVDACEWPGCWPHSSAKGPPAWFQTLPTHPSPPIFPHSIITLVSSYVGLFTSISAPLISPCNITLLMSLFRAVFTFTHLSFFLLSVHTRLIYALPCAFLDSCPRHFPRNPHAHCHLPFPSSRSITRLQTGLRLRRMVSDYCASGNSRTFFTRAGW